MVFRILVFLCINCIILEFWDTKPVNALLACKCLSLRGYLEHAFHHTLFFSLFLVLGFDYNCLKNIMGQYGKKVFKIAKSEHKLYF